MLFFCLVTLAEPPKQTLVFSLSFLFAIRALFMSVRNIIHSKDIHSSFLNYKTLVLELVFVRRFFGKCKHFIILGVSRYRSFLSKPRCRNHVTWIQAVFDIFLEK